MAELYTYYVIRALRSSSSSLIWLQLGFGLAGAVTISFVKIIVKVEFSSFKEKLVKRPEYYVYQIHLPENNFLSIYKSKIKSINVFFL